MDNLLNNEGTWRLSAFIILLLILPLWEVFFPRRKKHSNFETRRFHNLLLVIIDTVLVRLLMPLLPVAAAIYATTNQLGLFNQIEIPIILSLLLSVVILDLVIYFQHRLFHKIPLLWRLHRVHHTDVAFDFTTALRFHPIEIMLSILVKILIIFILGAPAIAVIAFEILLSSSALFNHSNIQIPLSIDKVLRLLIVTPDMHRVHHSVHQHETDSNFGFNIPWWDRLFKTYTAQPKDGHNDMLIGIETFRETNDSRIDKLLIQPFKRAKAQKQ